MASYPGSWPRYKPLQLLSLPLRDPIHKTELPLYYQPSARGIFSTMPCDVVLEIIGWLPARDTTTLASLAHTARFLADAVPPRLYRNIVKWTLSRDRLDAWAAGLLAARDDWRVLVRSVEVELRGFAGVRFGELLEQLPRLERLSLRAHTYEEPRPHVAARIQEFPAAATLKRLSVDYCTLRRSVMLQILRASTQLEELRVHQWPAYETHDDIRRALVGASATSPPASLDDGYDADDDTVVLPVVRSVKALPEVKIVDLSHVLPRLRFIEAPSNVLHALVPGRPVDTVYISNHQTRGFIEAADQSLVKITTAKVHFDDGAGMDAFCDALPHLDRLILDSVHSTVIERWSQGDIPPAWRSLNAVRVFEVNGILERAAGKALEEKVFVELDKHLRETFPLLQKIVIFERGLFNFRLPAYSAPAFDLLRADYSSAEYVIHEMYRR